MGGPLILPKRYGDRVEEGIATLANAAPARVEVAQTYLRKKGVNVFRCPVCRKEFRHDDEYEPMCTGWNETTDDHPMTVMEHVRVEEAAPELLHVAQVPPLTIVPKPEPAIRKWQGLYCDEDIYVIASGGSLNYFDADFFKGKHVIAVNSSCRIWGGVQPDFIVVKEHKEEALPNREAFPQAEIICSRGPYGYTNGDNAVEFTPEQNVTLFDHMHNKAGDFDVYRDWPDDPDSLVVSMSTITTAMHFAAYMGAATILVVGHDCGRMGDDLYVKGYEDQQPEWLPGWLAAIERQSLAVKRELVRRYGCRIYGLSPFITPNLDGVPYVGGSNRINTW